MGWDTEFAGVRCRFRDTKWNHAKRVRRAGMSEEKEMTCVEILHNELSKLDTSYDEVVKAKAEEAPVSFVYQNKSYTWKKVEPYGMWEIVDKKGEITRLDKSIEGFIRETFYNPEGALAEAQRIDSNPKKTKGNGKEKKVPELEQALEFVSATSEIWRLNYISPSIVVPYLRSPTFGEMTRVDNIKSIVGLLRTGAYGDHGRFPVFKDKFDVFESEMAQKKEIAVVAEVSATGHRVDGNHLVYCGDVLELRESREIHQEVKSKIAPVSYNNLLAMLACMYHGISFSKMNALPILKGVGGNGKSSFLMAIKYCFSVPRAHTPILKVLTEMDSLPQTALSLIIKGTGNFVCAGIHDKVIAHFQEFRYGNKSIDDVKRLTSGDQVRDERKGKDAIDRQYMGYCFADSNYPVPETVLSDDAESRRICPILYIAPTLKASEMDIEMDRKIARSMGFFVEEALNKLEEIRKEHPNESPSSLLKKMWVPVREQKMLDEAKKYEFFGDQLVWVNDVVTIPKDSFDYNRPKKFFTDAKVVRKFALKVISQYESRASWMEAAADGFMRECKIASDKAMKEAGIRFKDPQSEMAKSLLYVQIKKEVLELVILRGSSQSQKSGAIVVNGEELTCMRSIIEDIPQDEEEEIIL